jgi:hypothetical protein
MNRAAGEGPGTRKHVSHVAADSGTPDYSLLSADWVLACLGFASSVHGAGL